MAASTELVTPHRSSTGIVQLTPVTRVKVENAEEMITILSDDSDGNSPVVASLIRSPLINNSLPELSQKSHILLSHPSPQDGNEKSISVVDSLRKIWASKGVRNIFKTLDFDTLDIQRVKFLLPTFNGDVLFELPPVDTSGPFHMMHGMDKRHDGHAWTKTVTSNIKSDISLTQGHNSAIVMEASKELVGELLINPDGAPVRKYDLEELVPVLEKCKYMSSPSIKNDVTAFRYIRRFGVMDGITTLRGCNH
jgi:hypothetical protein